MRRENFNMQYMKNDASNTSNTSNTLKEVVIDTRDERRNNFPKQKTGTSIWGPHLWFVMHYAALYYPQNPTFHERKHMRNFILSLPILIPCNTCKQDTIQYIEKRLRDIDKIVSSRDLLFEFFVHFHNYVNEKTGKPIYGVEQAYNLYLNNLTISINNFNLYLKY